MRENEESGSVIKALGAFNDGAACRHASVASFARMIFVTINVKFGMVLRISAGGERKALIDGGIRRGLTGNIVGPSPPGTAAFFRYSLIGLLATCVHFVVLLVLVELGGASAVLSAAIGATLGALVAYAGNHRFTFSSRAPHGQALPRFVVVATFGAIASGSIVWAGTEQLRMHYLLAQLVATVLILWTGFVLNRRWTFS